MMISSCSVCPAHANRVGLVYFSAFCSLHYLCLNRYNPPPRSHHTTYVSNLHPPPSPTAPPPPLHRQSGKAQEAFAALARKVWGLVLLHASTRCSRDASILGTLHLPHTLLYNYLTTHSITYLPALPTYTTSHFFPVQTEPRFWLSLLRAHPSLLTAVPGRLAHALTLIVGIRRTATPVAATATTTTTTTSTFGPAPHLPAAHRSASHCTAGIILTHCCAHPAAHSRSSSVFVAHTR